MDVEWKMANARKPSRSPKPPSVAVPSKDKKKMPAMPAPAKQFVRSLSAGPKMQSTVKFAGSAGPASPAASRVGDGDESQTPKTPAYRRGPRASATVLPSKEELSMSQKKSKRRKVKKVGPGRDSDHDGYSASKASTPHHPWISPTRMTMAAEARLHSRGVCGQVATTLS